jgi:hypothetical protein
MSGIPGLAPQMVELANNKSNERDGPDWHCNGSINERLAAQDCQNERTAKDYGGRGTLVERTRTLRRGPR